MTARRGWSIVAAVLLPPLGVYLERGLGSHFWIAAALTLLAYLPGVAFALYSILVDRERSVQRPLPAA
jgi:uncharacterized membrane protein YqaE (UPF0057 family)